MDETQEIIEESQENIEESQDIIEEDAQTEPSKIKHKRVMSDLQKQSLIKAREKAALLRNELKKVKPIVKKVGKLEKKLLDIKQEEPIKEQPIIEEPIKEQPIIEEPIKQESIKEEPYKPQLVKKDGFFYII